LKLFPNVASAQHHRYALRFTTAFLIIGVLWVLFSDIIITHLLADTDLFASYLHYKRLVNVSMTGLLLYFLVRKTLQQIKTQHTLNAGIDHWKFVLEGPGDGVWDWDLVSGQIELSARWKEIFGYPDVNLGTSRKELGKLVHPEDINQARQEVESFIKGEAEVLASEFRLLCADGSWRWVLSRGMLFSETLGGKPTRLIGTHTDISARKLSEEKYFHLAHYDQTTRLPNRVLFLDRLATDVKRAARSSQSITLFYLDLDKFKEVNDTLGHEVGNLLLQETGDRLTSCVRAADTVARMGGDEFAVILNSLDDLFTAERIAQAILAKMAEPFNLEGNVIYITCSIGISVYPQDGENLEVLMNNADQAMYAAKMRGRNCYNYFTASLQDIATRRMHLVNDLRLATCNNEFKLYYQPIVQLATGKVHKAEALIRWQHPTRGLVSPGEFIPIAENTGLIVEIGQWVFEESARQVKQWRSHHPDFQISINKSPIQFKSESGCHQDWIDHLVSNGLPGESIVIEITEGLLLDANGPIIDQLNGFRASGTQIAIDDFGTGYSSLAYLRKFEMDYVKIDQSFTFNITTSQSDLALCEVIILMASKLGMKVIAEGIETQEQLDLLVGLGCDYGQGYFFSKPIPAGEFETHFIAA